MQHLPAAMAPMAAFRQFIVYKLTPSTTRPGKTDKQPVDFRTGLVSRDIEARTDAATACAAAAALGAGYGVGFEFTDQDPFWFLDIDSCLGPDNTWSPRAMELCAQFAGALVEVSSSGRGLHIIGSGAAPAHRSKPRKDDHSGQGLEFYTEKRFVALTGTHAVGNPATDHTSAVFGLVARHFMPDAAGSAVAPGWGEGPCAGWNGPSDDEKLIERMLRSQSAASAFGGGASFRDLWECNVEVLAKVYPPDSNGTGSLPYDGNRADSALAQRLAFWTGKDSERMERLMLRSAMVRAKWEREDYLPRTIAAVNARQADVLSDKLPEPVAGAHSLANMQQPPAESTKARATIVEGSTYLDADQQIEMFDGCSYIYDLGRVLTPGGFLLKPADFKVMFGGYTYVIDGVNGRTTHDAFEVFTQSQIFRAPRADSTCFKPDRAPGEIIHDAGRTRANVWWPVEVPRQVGDITPFMTHLAKLLPVERDRQILLSYMAACIQYKGYKIQWAPLIQGVEGNGKTFLTRCVAEAIGKRYVHWPKASKLTAQFNGWMRNKLFYGVEDIYVGSAKREVWEEVKPMITGIDLEIEGKGIDQVTSDICGNFMINSNHKDALPKTRRDRRIAVFYTAQQTPEDLARDGMTGDYFPNLYDWARAGGYAIVSELLHTWPIPDEFNPTTRCQRAPDTSSTLEAIEESLGGIEQEVMEAIYQELPGFAGGWVSSMALDKLLADAGTLRRIPHNKRKELMASLGYVYHPALLDGRVNGVVAPDGGKPRLFVRKDGPLLLLTNALEVARAYSDAQTKQVQINS